MRPHSLLLGLCALGACADHPTSPTPDATCSTPLSLRAGEVRVISGATAVGCITIAASSEATDYLFVTANSAGEGGDARIYSVNASIAGQPAAKAILPQASGPAVSAARAVYDVRDTFEDRLRRVEQQMMAGRSLSTLASAGAAPPMSASAARTAAAAPRVGDVLSFRLGDIATGTGCDNPTTIQAVVKAVGVRALVVQDVSAPARGFTDADFSAIAGEFDTLIYPTDVQWFGTPTDVNVDGRITILYTPMVNRLTPPGSLGFVGGYFFISDLLPRSVPSQSWRCDASNEQEVFYLLAPDPDGEINGNRHSVSSALESTRGTMAHELQHMINQGTRQAKSGADRLEVPWLNEGLSHLAEELVGRAARGYSDARRLTWNDVLADLDDFDAFFRQNLIRLRQWMDRPDLASPISARAGSELAPRGAAWALLRYAIDQYAGNNAPAFVRALAAGPDVSVANLEARTHTPFADLLPGFLLANFAGTGSPGPSARYRYTSWAIRDVMENLNGGVFPLAVTPLPATLQSRSEPGSGNYFLLSRGAGGQAATFRMLSSAGGPVDFGGASVYVMRVK